MKTKYTLFRRGEVFYIQDSATGKQTSLKTKDETEAKSLLEARNAAQRQPVLNLHLARAYLTASDPAFVERTWQVVMEQLQNRGKDSSRERYATVFKSASFDSLRRKKLLETTADDFFAVFKDGKVSIVYFLKRLHNFALSLGWIALPVVAPYLWPKYEAKERRGITPDEQQSILAIEKKAEWKFFLELLWETGAAQGDAAAMTAEDVDWQSRTITYFRKKTGSRAQFTISKALETVLSHYHYLLDVVYSGPNVTHLVLLYTFLIVKVRGTNLLPIVMALELGTADFIQEFDAERWPKPKDAKAPLIESIEVVVKENGPEVEETENTVKAKPGLNLH